MSIPTSKLASPGNPPAVVITGGAGGIGLATAKRYAREGYRVALVDLPGPALDEALASLNAMETECLSIGSDVSDHEAALKHGSAVLAQWGHIDVLVNNAAMSQTKMLMDLSEAEWDRTIDVNLKGYFNWCKAVAPSMLGNGYGRIINVSSVSANTGAGPNAASKGAYVTAKAGILGLTRALARELAPRVQVNAVCPGAIDTQMTQAHFSLRRDAIEAGIPLRRLGTPADIAEVIYFLGASQPCYLTGEIIDVDGGQWIN